MTARIDAAGLGPLSALLIEDNDHMRILLRQLLNAFYIKDIDECREGSEGLQRLSIKKPDFIVTDLLMNPMDGIQFTRAVRRLPADDQCVLPIIMVTAYTERRRVEAARDAGVTEILAKPITAAGLFQRIEEIVLRPRPFVRCATYCGPCRRRHNNPEFTGPWRRKSDAETVNIDTAKAETAEDANV